MVWRGPLAACLPVFLALACNSTGGTPDGSSADDGAEEPADGMFVDGDGGSDEPADVAAGDGDGLSDFFSGIPQHLEGDIYTGTQTGGVRLLFLGFAVLVALCVPLRFLATQERERQNRRTTNFSPHSPVSAAAVRDC